VWVVGEDFVQVVCGNQFMEMALGKQILELVGDARNGFRKSFFRMQI